MSPQYPQGATKRRYAKLCDWASPEYEVVWISAETALSQAQ